MADSFTPTLNLRKPEVGAATDTWGGAAGLNGDLDLIDAVFLATGLGTSVGLHVGTGKVLNVEGQLQQKDTTDLTKVGTFSMDQIAPATTVDLKFPAIGGTIATLAAVQAVHPVGTILSGYYGATAPSGYVFADGRTIGDATSGATRANLDCERLFLHLWAITAQTQCPVLTSAGAASTRGANAAADWAAHKRFTLPDHSGRGMFGRDNMSGTVRGRLTAAISGVPGTTLGGTGGDERSQNHTHTITDPGHTHPMLTRQDLAAPAGAAGAFAASMDNLGQTTNSATTGITGTNGSGAGGSQNIPPAIVVDVIIAL